MSLWVPLLLAALSVTQALRRRSLRYLRYFQQEEYDGRRFTAWHLRHRAFDTRLSLIALAAVAAFLAWPSPEALPHPAWWFASGLFLLWPNLEADPRSTGKLTLKMTARVRRIHLASSSLTLAGSALAALVAHELHRRGIADPGVAFWSLALLLAQASPFSLVLGNALLAPYERRLQRGFIQQARARLELIRPLVVGITGSYGKTSTKTILASFLQTLGPTFWPPRSINTEMGIAREIRERLSDAHRFAIIEMGAYRKGSIARLCSLTPPNAAIVTCVGVMHLERFGSPQAILEAKSELAQALPPQGILVCNGDDPGARRIATDHPRAVTLLYGYDAAGLDARITDLTCSAQGSRFNLHWRGETHEALTPLLGRPMISNLLAAFTLAAHLGAKPQALLAEARLLQPAEHRLEPKPRGAGITLLDDSYNSNPAGFAAALEVLALFPAKRRWLVTPGMVELGELQAPENQRLAQTAGGLCDEVILLGDTNRAALEAGLAGSKARTRWVPHRDQANALLDAEAAPGDVILWENDLPDVYEDCPRF